MDHSKDTKALLYESPKRALMVFVHLELLGCSHSLDLGVSKTWQMY